MESHQVKTEHLGDLPSLGRGPGGAVVVVTRNPEGGVIGLDLGIEKWENVALRAEWDWTRTEPGHSPVQGVWSPPTLRV